MAGSVVVKDVAALDQFANRLARAKTQMEQVAKELSGAINGVSSSWQDPQKDKCEREIQQIIRAMSGFAQQADSQVRYCKKLGSQIRSMP